MVRCCAAHFGDSNGTGQSHGLLATMPSEPHSSAAYRRALQSWLEAAAAMHEFFEHGDSDLPFDELPSRWEKSEEAFREWRRLGALWVGQKP